jgi:hypothetical protein
MVQIGVRNLEILRGLLPRFGLVSASSVVDVSILDEHPGIIDPVYQRALEELGTQRGIYENRTKDQGHPLRSL